MAALLIAMTAAVVLGIRPLVGSQASLAAAATPALVGFSFSPRSATFLGLDPTASLQTLLVQLTPDLVRLPVFKVLPCRALPNRPSKSAPTRGLDALFPLCLLGLQAGSRGVAIRLPSIPI